MEKDILIKILEKVDKIHDEMHEEIGGLREEMHEEIN